MIDGLEMQLLVLKDLSDTAQFADQLLDACAECYQPVELCTCRKPQLWPIADVIRKLTMALARYDRALN
jgi:hypothetical protein